ncbi:N-acetylneuraminate synthase family protein [Pelagibacteraceae bacterium]|nr:N-acetylneuraminate synthase family protein [Pelagibacteraceae bacterium]
MSSKLQRKSFKIENKTIGPNNKTFFIADIAANHDNNLNKAIDLIHLAAEAGADAAKFQHFTAETIVSDKGFQLLNTKLSHQKSWNKSVYDTYKDASLNIEWTEKLKNECKKANIIFFTSPYSLKIVDEINKFVSVYKIGSGDITWLEIIERISKKNKPVFLATGASNMKDVDKAVKAVLKHNKKLCLMQCNTNYTASLKNFEYINLNVLKSFNLKYPSILTGLSDHTPGHSTVLGAIALGISAVEKHFTDNNNLEGPDHKFSMNPKSWKEMVDRSRELEISLGSNIKKVERNEVDTHILQRRSYIANKIVKKNTDIKIEDFDLLRPCPKNSVEPSMIKKVLGKKTNKNISIGQSLKWSHIK